MTGQLVAVHVTGKLTHWQACGFATRDSCVPIGQSEIRTVTASSGDASTGVVSVALDGVDDLDGLDLAMHAGQSAVPAEPTRSRDGAVPEHPNGVFAIDHIVATTPDVSRTTQAFERAGFEARRVRSIGEGSDARVQTFFWFGDVICELVGPAQPTGDEPAQWWGIALTTSNLRRSATAFGDHLSPIRPAVQAGREVATVRRSAQLDVPLLLISPHG